ncbi:Glutathione S-transferase kappa 1, partial [Trichostrongylus colubriformis]
VLTNSGITNGAKLIDQMDCDYAATELEQNTKTALDTGAFGAPWIVVHKDGEEHTFFGSDRLHLIAHLIGQKFTDGLVQYSKL